MRRSIGMLTMLALASAAMASGAERHDGWTASWGAAQIRVEGDEAAKAPLPGPMTLRQTVRLSTGGKRMRVRLSNLFGDAPLTIGGAAVALPIAKGAPAVQRGSVRMLRFGGAARTIIPQGAELYSDPVALQVDRGADLSITLYLPAPPPRRTGHPGSRATAFTVPGDQVGSPSFTGARAIGGWHQIADVEVEGSTSGAIVAIGDSITDGYGVRADSNTRWTDVLAARLRADGRRRTLAVLNSGIGGNRVLLDGIGPSLVSRFDRDVLARAGMRHAILLEGVNDLGVLTRDAPVGSDDHRRIVAAITGAYRQLAERAHARGIRLIGGTITPFAGNDYYHPGAQTEADRQAINAFIRGSGVFDGVVDFDRVLRDPAHPDRLAPAYDSGDHLHPSEAGYRAMAEAVPLTLFDGAETDRRPAIALTFDDMPAHGPLPAGETRLGIARTIVAALRARAVPAHGFVNGGVGTGDAGSAQVLDLWRDASFPIGNHTWSHPNLEAMDAPAYLAEIDRNVPLSSPADERWFRYPFLSEGTDPARRESVRAGLRARGYRVAAVTMSFGDYAWNDAYARCAARQETAAIAGLERSFLDAARAQALRARALAKATLGRDIPYVLLLHLGAFDARMMPRLLDLYAGLGFRFVPLAQAQADPFYRAANELALPGPSPTLEAAARARRLPVPADAPLPGPDVCG